MFTTSLLAYVALWVGGQAPWSRYLDHDLALVGSSLPVAWVVFVLGWTVMVTAMMLPTALPLFDAFARVVGRRPEHRRLLFILASGFVGVWAAFGFVVIWADLGVHAVVERVAALAERPQLIAAVVLAGAGLYQFSALKQRCLSRCRSPLSLIVPRWTGRAAGADALRIGIDYGVWCLGCCWTLMLLVFAVGTGNVGAMLVFGLLMAVEKNVPRARALTPALGVVLVVAAGAIALSALT